MRPRQHVRLEVIALFGLIAGGLLTVPWWTLSAIGALYLASLPLAAVLYARVKRRRAAAVLGEPDAPA